MRNLSDSQLVTRALRGAPAAYRELVRRYERPILSLIRRMVGRAEDAEDLAQEAFIKAFRNLESYDPSRKLSSWLFKIAHNTTIDRLRRKQLETVPLQALSSDGEESWDVLEVPEEQSPHRRAERSEVASAIEAALGRLRPQYREALILRFQHGLSYQEIADILGLRMGTVKIHLHRARKQLASELAEAGFEPPERFAEKNVTTTESTP